MNKIFKIVWSKVRNCYVVVSEIAKNTVSGVGNRNRVKRFSIGSALATIALTSSFFLPSEGLAAESALVGAEYYNYIAIKATSPSTNPFGEGSSLYTGSDNQTYIDVVVNGETLKYVYTLVDSDGVFDGDSSDDVAYWIRDGFGVKAIQDQYHDQATNVKLDLYKVPGTNASYDSISMSGSHIITPTSATTAINKVSLDKFSYKQFAAMSNGGGIDTPSGWNYYIAREVNGNEQYVDVGGNNFSTNFYEFKAGEFNALTGKYTFKGHDVEYENVYRVGSKIGVFLTNSAYNASYNNITSSDLPDNVDVYGGAVYGKNNEILLSGYDSESNTWSTVWAGEITDPYATVDSMTLSEFNEILEHLHKEDLKLLNEGIVGIKAVGNDANSGTLSLINKSGNSTNGLTISNSGGTQGVDTRLTFTGAGSYVGDDGQTKTYNESFTLETGSKVEANKVGTNNNYNTLNTLTINGITYNVGGTSGGVTTTSNMVTLTKGKNIEITSTVSDGVTNYTISSTAENTTYTVDDGVRDSETGDIVYTIKDNKDNTIGTIRDTDTDTNTLYVVTANAKNEQTGSTTYQVKASNGNVYDIIDTNNYISSASVENNNLVLKRVGLTDITIPLSEITQGLATTDAKLIVNPVANSSGNYSVDGSGNVSLIVSDGTNQTPVTITGVASRDFVNTAVDNAKVKVEAGSNNVTVNEVTENNKTVYKVSVIDTDSKLRNDKADKTPIAGGNEYKIWDTTDNYVILEDVASAAQVATNMSNIQSLTSRVTANEDNITALGVRVATNETSISTLNTQVYENTIKIVNVINGNVFRISAKSDNTINLQRGEGTNATVDSTISVTGSGGNGTDRIITFGTGDDAFSIEVGSVVKVTDQTNGVLTALEINGTPYSLIHAGNLANANNLSVSGGNGTSTDTNEKHGWTLFDKAQSGISYVDTTLVKGDAVPSSVTDSGRTYTIYDTAGNAVVLNDVASAKQVATNAANITINASDIDKLETSVSTNTANITTNTANITTNASDIDKLETSVSTNTANITTNAANITINASDIDKLETSVSTNTANISTNTANISTNTANITTNTANITTNTANITTNANNITALDTRVTNNYNNSVKSIDIGGGTGSGTISLSRNVGSVPGTLTISTSGGGESGNHDNVKVTISNVIDGVTNSIELTTGSLVSASVVDGTSNTLESIYINGNRYVLPSHKTEDGAFDDWRVGAGVKGGDYANYVNSLNATGNTYGDTGYVVDDNGIVQLDIIDQSEISGEVKGKVYIANVAKASDLSELKNNVGNVSNVTVNLAEGTANNVVNHINNLYNQVSAEAAKDTIVTHGDSNIVVVPEEVNGDIQYTVSLSSTVDVSSQLKVGNDITLNGTNGMIGAHWVTAQTIEAIDNFKVGDVYITNMSVVGLDNKEWDEENIVSGRAATEDQLKKAISGVKSGVTDIEVDITEVNSKLVTLENDDIKEFYVSTADSKNVVGLIRNDGSTIGNAVEFTTVNSYNADTKLVVSSSGASFELETGSRVAVAQSTDTTTITVNGVDKHIFNKYTTSATLNDKVLTFTHNETNSTYQVDLSSLTTELMSGWTAQVNGANGISVTDGKVLNYVAGNNIALSSVTNDAGGNITVATQDQVDFKEVTVAGADDNSKVVIDNTGIAMGNQKITGLADGEVTSTSNDAVNGSQLWNAMQQDIEKIVVTPNSGANATGGTVALWRNSTTGTTDTVPGTLTFISGGGTSAEHHQDTYIVIGQDDSGNQIKLTTGSKVVGITVNDYANAQGSYEWGADLQAIVINGQAHKVGQVLSGNPSMHDYHIVMESQDGIGLGSEYNNAMAYKADSSGVITLDVQNNQDPNENDANYPARHVYIADVASKTALDNLTSEVEEVKDRVTGVEERTTNVENRITNVEGRTTNLENRSTNVENRVTNVEKRTTNLENRTTDVENRMANVEGRTTNLENRTTNVENRMTNVEERTTNLENRTTNVENRMTNVEGRTTNLESRTTDVENRVTEVESNFITQGNIVENGGSIELKNSKGDVKATVEGLSDYALEARNDYKVDGGKVTLKIKDRFGGEGKEVVINDVASASDLKDLSDTVGATTKDGLKESYKDTTYLKDIQKETETGTVTEAGASSLVEADIKLDKAIKDNAERDYNNDLILQNQIQNQTAYLDSRINQLGSKVNKVGAGAAALAALHPMDFDPDDKLSFAVGAGNYAGETATALGAFYRPNEKVMMNVAGTYGNGENMVNMGVSFALDRTNHVSNSRTAMAKEIVDLREQVATQGQQIAQLVALVQQLAGVQQPVVPAEQLFPDVPENHWAYEYVNTLVSKGIIEGYPDGTFGGDRTMTRYEFAAMLFRAMEQGVVLSEQIRQEFEKELGRVRVDRVKGADNDPNKIERVRVNKAADRDNYGSKIVQVKH